MDADDIQLIMIDDEDIDQEYEDKNIIDNNIEFNVLDVAEYTQEDIKTIVPRYNKMFQFGDNKYRACTLNSDDFLKKLFKDFNYQQSEYIYDGKLYTQKSINNYIDIFRIYKIENEEEILLTESFDYVNEQVYIHDNIKTTKYFNKNKNLLQNDVIEIYKMHAKELNKISLEALKKYVRLNPLELPKKELDEIIERQTIKLVSVNVDSDSDDLEFNNILSENSEDIRHSKYIEKNNRNISRQMIIYKNGDIISSSPNYIEKLIYVDDRVISEKNYDTLNDDDILKIKRIELDAFYYYDVLIHFDVCYDRKDILNKISEDTKCEEKELKVILGEDYYIVIVDKDDELYIFSLAKCSARLDEEKERQAKEIINLIQKTANLSIVKDDNGNIIKTKKIRAYMKEDTSYRFYKCYKKRGYINELSNDIEYDEDYELITHYVEFNVSDKYLKKLRK